MILRDRRRLRHQPRERLDVFGKPETVDVENLCAEVSNQTVESIAAGNRRHDFVGCEEMIVDAVTRQLPIVSTGLNDRDTHASRGRRFGDIDQGRPVVEQLLGLTPVRVQKKRHLGHVQHVCISKGWKPAGPSAARASSTGRVPTADGTSESDSATTRARATWTSPRRANGYP